MEDLINPKAHLKTLIESAFKESEREERVWTPTTVHSYIIQLITAKVTKRPPKDLLQAVIERHLKIPHEPSDRFEHLRQLADGILYWRVYWQEPCPIRLELNAQMYYDDAAVTARKIREPSEVFVHLAEDLPKYAPVIRKTCIRIVA